MLQYGRTMAIQENSGLCRSCAAPVTPARKPCPQCGGHKFLFHPELTRLSIAHIDCDAFFASVEKRDNPELIDKPVIIGGGKRGVVAAACYQARVYGVHSAMPMFKALKACPNAVVIRPNHDKYSHEGRRVKDLMCTLTPLVESLSIDEAFLDLTGTERLHGCSPATSLIKLQNKIQAEIGITVSIGLSYNKFLAKTASDLDKPGGFAVLGRTEALNFLADKPVDFIFGVGPAFARKLKACGIISIKDVRRHSDEWMYKNFGEAGIRLARLARAEDNRKVTPVSIRKSISTEITFERDIDHREELLRRLWLVCVKTSDRAKAKNLAGRVVTLKLKSANFKTLTRRRSFETPVQLADTLYHITRPLLSHVMNDPKAPSKFRLIGVGLSDLCPPDTEITSLLDQGASDRAKAERAKDIVRAKFGKDSLIMGRALPRKT